MIDYFVLVAAAFFAGMLNTIAGGGTFLTFPALIYVGIPPVIANATSAVAVFPGYLGGAAGFRKELRGVNRSLLIRALAMTVAGGVVGSLLLLISSNEAFSVVVPFLLFIATAAFAFGDRFQEWVRRSGFVLSPRGTPSMLLVSIYGGYFNGGLGIMLLALFSLWGMRDLNLMNGLKNGLSFALSAISVVVFMVAGLVEWSHALIMMAAATLGGYGGASVARRLPKSVVRAVVILIGLTMGVVFLLRLFA